MSGRQTVMTIVTIKTSSKKAKMRKIKTNNKPKQVVISPWCKNPRCKLGQQKMTGRQTLTIEKACGFDVKLRVKSLLWFCQV